KFYYRSKLCRHCFFFFFSSRRRHTRSKRDWSSDVCSSDLHSNSHIPWWLSRRAGIDDGKPIADRLGLATVYLDPSPARVTEDERSEERRVGKECRCRWWP